MKLQLKVETEWYLKSFFCRLRRFYHSQVVWYSGKLKTHQRGFLGFLGYITSPRLNLAR